MSEGSGCLPRLPAMDRFLLVLEILLLKWEWRCYQELRMIDDQRSGKAAGNSQSSADDWDVHKLPVLFYTHTNPPLIDRQWLVVVFVSALHPLSNLPSSDWELGSGEVEQANKDASQKGQLNTQSCASYLGQEFTEDKGEVAHRSLGLIVILGKYLGRVCYAADVAGI